MIKASRLAMAARKCKTHNQVWRMQKVVECMYNDNKISAFTYAYCSGALCVMLMDVVK